MYMYVYTFALKTENLHFVFPLNITSKSYFNKR